MGMWKQCQYSIRQLLEFQLCLHYYNTPMLYTAIFHGCKNGNFQMKNCDIFLIFAQNVDRGYMLRRF